MSITRREFPNVNDAIVDRQRRVSGCSVAEVGQLPVRRPAPAGARRIAEIEARLVQSYNTPSDDATLFLTVAQELADALIETSSPGAGAVVRCAP